MPIVDQSLFGRRARVSYLRPSGEVTHVTGRIDPPDPGADSGVVLVVLVSPELGITQPIRSDQLESCEIVPDRPATVANFPGGNPVWFG